MRWKALLAALIAAPFVPSPASAVVAVNVETLTPMFANVDQTVFLEVYLTDLGGSNERLNAFVLSVDAGPGFSESGLRFLQPTRVPNAQPHPYVFGGFPGATLEDIESTASRIQVAAELPSPGDEVDVSELRNGLIRIPVLIPADFRPPAGLYVLPVTVDLVNTQFAGAGAPIVAVQGRPGGFASVPEPSAAALLALPAFALLRRRRTK